MTAPEEKKAEVEPAASAPEAPAKTGAYGRRRNKAAAPPPEPVPDPALAEAQAQAAEYLDLAQRARAEFENYRRRTKESEAEALLRGKAEAILQLLPVLDNLQRALEAVPSQDGAEDPFAQGVVMVARQFEEALSGLEVAPVADLNAAFDPAVHYAVGQELRPETAPGTVTQVLQKGYTLGEALLRPSMVLVQGEEK